MFHKSRWTFIDYFPYSVPKYNSNSLQNFSLGLRYTIHSCYAVSISSVMCAPIYRSNNFRYIFLYYLSKLAYFRKFGSFFFNSSTFLALHQISIYLHDSNNLLKLSNETSSSFSSPITFTTRCPTNGSSAGISRVLPRKSNIY